MGQPFFFGPPGAGRVLGVTPERARQMFRANLIPTIALLNGKTPLVDEATLTEIANQRSQKRLARVSELKKSA